MVIIWSRADEGQVLMALVVSTAPAETQPFDPFVLDPGRSSAPQQQVTAGCCNCC